MRICHSENFIPNNFPLYYICVCHIPGDFQGQAGWGSGQPDLAEDVPVYCRGAGLDNI